MDQLLCTGYITGYTLIDPSSGVILCAFGSGVREYMSSQIELSRERVALTSILDSPDTPDTVEVLGEKCVIVRRETSFIVAVSIQGEIRKRSRTFSIHSLYAGTLVVSYKTKGLGSQACVSAVLGALAMDG